MLRAVTLNVIMLRVVMLTVVMLSVIMLNVVMLNVVMLSVMVPTKLLINFLRSQLGLGCVTIRVIRSFHICLLMLRSPYTDPEITERPVVQGTLTEGEDSSIQLTSSLR
jgi:hypothetical protein